MALVELRPVRVSSRSQPRSPAPANTAKIAVGPIIIEQRLSGDLLIYTRAVHPVTSRVAECDVTIHREVVSNDKLVIKNEHVPDLMVALDAVLGNRKPGT